MADVQILVKPGCIRCVKVQKMLDELKVKYEIIDIAENPGILKKYPLALLPGIVIGGKLEFQGTPDIGVLKQKAGI